LVERRRFFGAEPAWQTVRLSVFGEAAFGAGWRRFSPSLLTDCSSNSSFTNRKRRVFAPNAAKALSNQLVRSAPDRTFERRKKKKLKMKSSEQTNEPPVTEFA
jgi:hypothetical protein